MSADSLWDVQAGVFTRLTGTAGLTALLAGGAAGVRDHVPEGTAYPYLVIGEAAARPLETQAVSGNDVTITLHSYSRGAGMKEVKAIMAKIHDALHNASFSVPNQSLVLCRCLESTAQLEGDGLTRHGVQRFQIITEPSA